MKAALDFMLAGSIIFVVWFIIKVAV